MVSGQIEHAGDESISMELMQQRYADMTAEVDPDEFSHQGVRSHCALRKRSRRALRPHGKKDHAAAGGHGGDGQYPQPMNGAGERDGFFLLGRKLSAKPSGDFFEIRQQLPQPGPGKPWKQVPPAAHDMPAQVPQPVKRHQGGNAYARPPVNQKIAVSGFRKSPAGFGYMHVETCEKLNAHSERDSGVKPADRSIVLHFGLLSVRLLLQVLLELIHGLSEIFPVALPQRLLRFLQQPPGPG